MIYTIIPILLIFIFITESVNLSKKLVDFQIFFFIFFVSSIGAFRWDVGKDFEQYIKIFNFFNQQDSNINFISEYGNIEIGFKFLMELSSYAGGEVSFLFLSNFISLFLISLGLIKLRNDIYVNLSASLLFYILVFFIGYNFNAMRQAISMGVFIYSVPFILHNKSIKVLLLSLIALSFHSTGILIFISYISSRYLSIDNYKRIFIIIFLCLLFYIIHPVSYLLSIIGVDIVRWQDTWGSLSLSSIIQRLVVFFILISSPGLIYQNRSYQILLSIYCLGLLLYFGLSDVGMMATRFNMFYRVLEIIMIPIVITHTRNFYIKISIVILYLSLSLLSYIYAANLTENIFNFRF